ncbi:GNAT family N-acetyltransferase [Kitasatospora sp. NPDC127067]|uniref:GNAT family N-acetyltransferase n=1 Tax=Kitasatospora sp. NPDC127067 TaxID=3347126 RepID=UPI003651A3DD
MGSPNDTFRRLREVEWDMGRREAAEFLVGKSIEFGEPVLLVTRTIATWEDGDSTWPRAKYRRLLHKVTGKTATELGFIEPRQRGKKTRPEPLVQTEGGDEDMRRRSILLGAGAALLACAVPQTANAGTALGRDHVQALRDAEQTLYTQDHDHGSADLGQQATTALHTAHTWLDQGRYGEDLGRQLHTATGMLSVAAGWLALDAGRTADARSLYTEALASSRQGDDPGLEAHAFACLSLLAHATGRPREAVGNAQAAQRAATGLGSPRWMALLAMREARGWALQGDRTLTEAALVRAFDLYAKGPRDTDPDWLGFFVPGELAGLESLCRADLRQYDRAVAGAEQAVMLFAAGHARNRSLYTADIALHRARQARPRRCRRCRPQNPGLPSGRSLRTADPILARHRRRTASSREGAVHSRLPRRLPNRRPRCLKELMSVPSTPLALQRYGAGDAATLLDTLADIWAEAHAGHDDVAQAGFTPQTLRRQITTHALRDDFTLVVAFSAGHAVGFGYGFRCTAAYWYGEQLLPAITPEARDTDSLAGICELAVRIGWQGQGVGTRLHAALLEALRTALSASLG